ncbi:MAG: hypothetical protein AAFO82_10645, partial [Bacteroidota bacterium]
NIDPDLRATPPFLVTVDGMVVSSTYDGLTPLNIGTFTNGQLVLLQVEEAEDPNDCTDLCRDIVELDVNNFAPTLTIDATRPDFTCADGSDITLTANASSGNMAASFTYAWSTNETTQSIDVSMPDNYTVTVTEVGGNGCEAVTSLEILDNTFPPPSIMLVSSGCLTTVGGSVTLTVESTDAVTYLWSDNSTNQSLVVTTGGTYSVTATDVANGCENMESIDITPLSPVICQSTEVQDANNGNNGAIAAFASGGSGNFEYSINGVDFQSSNEFNGLAMGNYTITVRDADHPDCFTTCSE